MVTNLDPLKRNMYGITYAWYGSSNIIFEIYNPSTSIYENVHTISFANDSIEPSFTSPNMFVQNGVASLGSTTAMTIRTAGLYATCEGTIDYSTQPNHGFDFVKTIPSNTPTIIVAFKNRQTINGYSNNSEMLIDKYSCFCDGNKATVIKIIRNPTTLGASTTANYTNWQYIESADSVGLYNTTVDTFTGGVILDVLYLGKTGNLHVDLALNQIHVYQNDIILFVATSTAISDVGIAVSIVDDI